MISEFPLGTKPLPDHFGCVGSTIAGLARGCLIMEADLKSDALRVARWAMENGRDVFAVPGSIDNPQAKGCHRLIKEGAKLVESAEDILEEWGRSYVRV